MNDKLNTTNDHKSSHYWIFKLIELSFISIIKKWSLYLYVLLTVLISILACVVFIPYEIAGGIFYLFAMLFPVLLILGQSTYTIKNSTLYSNIETSGINKFRFYFSQLIIAVLFTFMISIVFWCLIAIIGIFPLFLDGWIGDGKVVDPFINPYTKEVIFQNIIYVMFVSSFLSFSVYFVMQQFFNTVIYYNMGMLSFLVIGLIFSGSLNNFFKVAGDSGSEHLVFSRSMFPKFMFIPSLFIPSYGLGQFTTMAVTQNSMPITSVAGMTADNFTYYSLGNNWQWTLVILQPYAIIASYLSVGSFLLWFKSK